jgi:hypothetical protein
MAAELLNVDDAFDCLHGFLHLMDTKKPAGGRALGGSLGKAQSGVVRMASNDYLRGETVMKTSW